MYNKKSKFSGIMLIFTALLFIGLLVWIPFIKLDNNVGLVILLMLGIGFFYYVLLYASAIAFIIVALVFGIKMLKQQDRNKLLSYNKKMLIATCVLLPFIALAFYLFCGLLYQSIFLIIAIVILAVFYLVSFIAQIATISKLKKMPEETETEQTVEQPVSE